MSISFKNALGIHEEALLLRAKRSETIANNLANVDTPNFLARDIDFREALRGADASNASQISVARTHPRHVATNQHPFDADLKYRNPMMPSEDGNTVNADGEYLRFAENAVRYQASLRFLGSRFRSMQNALRGE